MAVPWLRIIDAAIGVTDVARRVTRRNTSLDQQADFENAARGGPLEARLAGVVVAALKEAFDRDHVRLELERDQIDAERQRAERALRLELMRQAGDREVGRLRLLAAVAVVGWLATLFFSGDLVAGAALGRAALGIGWLLLLGALAASFAGQAEVNRRLARLAWPESRPAPPADAPPYDAQPGKRVAAEPARASGAPDETIDAASSGAAGAAAPWLIVAGLALIGLGVLLA